MGAIERRDGDFAVAVLQMAMTTECKHHWIISTPNGPVTPGQCEICYEEKDFPTPYMQTTYDKEQPRFPKILIRRTDDWDE